MNRYSLIEDQKKNGKAVYLPFLLLGFPNKDVTLEACKVMIEEGVHGFEFGLPFRDPVADGPVIQHASNEVLDTGFKINDALALLKKIRGLNDKIPFTLMCYYNMVFTRGVDRFFDELAEAGVDGILIPDMPPERAEEIAPLAEKHGLKLVFIAAPNSTDDRLQKIAAHATGFVYVVTRMGITGVNDTHSRALPDLFDRISKNIPLPAIAGFGISEPAHALNMVKAGANGVITGSRLVEILRQSTKNGALDPAPLRAHTRAMLDALDAA